MSRSLEKESIRLDYKATIDFSDPGKAAIELASDLVQFANSFGGELILGVKEDKVAEKLEVVGYEDLEEVRRFIHDKVLPLIHPQSVNPDISEEILDGKPIVLIRVEPLIEGVGFVIARQNESFKVPYRTDYGKKYMSAGEIEKRIGDSSRRSYLKVKQYFENQKIVAFVSPVMKDSLHGYIQVGPEYTFSFNTMHADHVQFFLNGNIFFNVPYSAIVDVWEGEIKGVSVLLNLDILVVSDYASGGAKIRLRRAP